MKPLNTDDDEAYPLIEAASNLEISMLECQELIVTGEEADIACWYFNPETKEEKIIIGPEGMKLSSEQLEMVLRHEILHKYQYKGFAPSLHNHELMNIALDVCINRLLYNTYPEKFKDLCDTIYGKYPENRHNILALAWAGLDPESIQDEEIKRLYKKIWISGNILSPREIYYSLLEGCFDEKHFKACAVSNPFGGGKGTKDRGKGKIVKGKGKSKDGENDAEGEDNDIGKGEEDGQGSVCVRKMTEEQIEDSDTGKIEKKIRDGFKKARAKGGRGGGFSNVISDWFDVVEAERESCKTSELEDFLNRIETVDVLDEVSSKITNAIIGLTQTQLYPYRLSRAGYVYLNTGISDIFHKYWNRVLEGRKQRLNIYVDTSPSMYWFREQEIFLIERFRDLFPTTFYVFAGQVKEFLIDDFIQGKYPTGSSTSFDSVIEHLAGSEAECGVIFTDGLSSISLVNRNKLKLSRKRLFTVYFSMEKAKKVKSDLDYISETVMQIDIEKKRKTFSQLQTIGK